MCQQHGGREQGDSPEQLSLDIAVNTEPSVLTHFFHFKIKTLAKIFLSGYCTFLLQAKPFYKF